MLKLRGNGLDEPNKNPLIDGILADESNQGGDDAAALPGRLNRYSQAHHRACEMAQYADQQGHVKLAYKLKSCGDYLVFRDYFTVSKVRLHAAYFCKKHLLCPFCAIRRGAKMLKAYLDRLQVILSDEPDLKPYLVTFTVKDGEDLLERFDHLQRSLQKLHKYRHLDRGHEVQKCVGAVWSYEFKRGKGSSLWHPHVHAVWLCREKPDQEKLVQQWQHITGDSFIVDVRPFHDDQSVVGGFLEVFKYAVKFSDLPLEDNFQGFELLTGKRLIAAFGAFRGVQVPEALTDEPLQDLPYVELFYSFRKNAGYTLVKSHAVGVPNMPDRA